jgi:hypothetical protein
MAGKISKATKDQFRLPIKTKANDLLGIFITLRIKTNNV